MRPRPSAEQIAVMTDVLVTAEPELQQITRAIVDIANPVRVVLFGSRARGNADPESDYDIMVEIDDGNRRDDRRRAIDDAMHANSWAVDLSIRTPGEFDKARDHPFYVDYDIARDGRVLYRRSDASAHWPGPPRVRESKEDAAWRAAPWLKSAEPDFATIDILASSGKDVPSSMYFHSHAAVEKLLKAAIYVAGTIPPHTHDLKQLLKLCPKELSDREDLRNACAFLYEKLATSRYADAGPPPTVDDGRRAYAVVNLVRDAVMPLLT